MSAPQKREKNLEAKTIGRRDLLKALTATGGAVTVAALVPGKWTKPVIEAGVMPAHAATSLISGDLRAVMNWSYGTPVDYELHVVDPCDGEDVFGGNTSSTTLTHSGDAAENSNGSETVTNTGGLVAPGTYQVYVRSINFQDPITTVDVSITVNGVTTDLGNMGDQFSGNNQSIRAADIVFPPGTVVNRIGDTYP